MTTAVKLSEHSYVTYASADDYNQAHPDAPMPFSPAGHNFQRGFTCASAGLVNDLSPEQHRYILAFLPGGVPGRNEPDRLGTIVATCWGAPPYLVLAENISLRQAWEDITACWPATLSGVLEVLGLPNGHHTSS